MKIGTRSVLYGAHCFFIHPWFVALAWWRLFGFPKDIRLWVAFLVHDLGYWGLPNMDGDEGESHPEFGAKVMHRLFDNKKPIGFEYYEWKFGQWGVPWLMGGETQERFDKMLIEGWEIVTFLSGSANSVVLKKPIYDKTWHNFALYHSRFYSKREGATPSPLCMADKLATCLEPWWLYLPRVIATGEIKEYMAMAGGQGKTSAQTKYDGEPVVSKYLSMGLRTRTRRQWHSDMIEYMKKWVDEHKDGRPDTWTPSA